MVCTTFLHDSELNQKLPDTDIQTLLEEVREMSGKNWQVVSLPARRIGIFRKEVPRLYGVYVYIGGIGPWQQINFFDGDTHRPEAHKKSSITFYVPLSVVAAFLYGLYNGLIAAKKGKA